MSKKFDPRIIVAIGETSRLIGAVLDLAIGAMSDADLDEIERVNDILDLQILRSRAMLDSAERRADRKTPS